MESTPSAFATPDSQTTLRLHASERPADSAGEGPDRSGQRLLQRYRLRGVLAKTHCACDLYQAEDELRQKPCTVKLLKRAGAADPKAHLHFLREVELLARLSHPNIIEAQGFDHDEQGSPFLVLEALAGCSLDHLLAERGPLGWPRVVQLVRASAAALQYAHDLGVIHGSLGASSIFIPEPGGASVVKLLDFEHGRLLDPSPSSASPAVPEAAGAVVSGPADAALYNDRAGVDERTDQCALAIVAYRLLSGRRPFAYESPAHPHGAAREAEPLERLVPSVPVYVARAIHIALSRDPAQRHPSVAAFARALEPPPLPRLDTTSPSDQTVHGFRADLIARCREESARTDCVPIALDDQQPTRRYPTETFARTMLTAAPPESPPAAAAAPRPHRRYHALVLCAVLLVLGGALAAYGRRPRTPPPVQTAQRVAPGELTALAVSSARADSRDGNELAWSAAPADCAPSPDDLKTQSDALPPPPTTPAPRPVARSHAPSSAHPRPPATAPPTPPPAEPAPPSAAAAEPAQWPELPTEAHNRSTD